MNACNSGNPPLTELRARRAHRIVQLEIAFLAFLSLTIWAIRELRGIL